MKKFSLYTKVALLFLLFPLALCGCDIWNVPLDNRVAFELKVKLVSSWAGLEAAVNNAADGDIIAITRSFSTVDASGNRASAGITITKNITITAYKGRENIYRQIGFNAAFFKIGTTGEGSLTLGHPLGGTLLLDSKGFSVPAPLIQVDGGSFILAGAELRNNINTTSASYPYDIGGAVQVQSGGHFIMTGGIISGNKAEGYEGKGGGVSIKDGSFTMSGGTISKNSSPYTGDGGGGGVYIYNGSFTMSGGTISENSAACMGGGVFIMGSSFIKSGASSIKGNISTTNSNGANVYANGGSTLIYRNTDAGPGMDIKAFYSSGGYIELSGFDD